MSGPLQVIGGGLAGSEAAWQAARAGVRVVLHEMRPGRATDAHKTATARRAGLLELVPLRRRAQQRGRPAARGDAPRGLADHARGRCPQAAGGWRARGRPRGLRRGRPGGARGGAPDRDPARGGRSPARSVLRPAIVATGPLTSAGLAASIRARDRRGRARLLRCDRADRPSRDDRLRDRLVAVALRQAGPGRQRRRLRQLPARPGRVRGLRRRAARGREARVQGVGDARRLTSRAACRSR